MTKIKKQPFSKLSPVFLTVTLMGLGKIPLFPGTIGSAVAALEFTAYLQLVGLKGLGTYYMHIAMMTPIIFYCTHSYIKNTGKKDPSEVIADEYLGQYIAQLTSYSFCSLMLEDFKHTFLLIFLSFLFFRIFDIVKPSLVGYCDQKIKGAMGVILDDVVAGIFASISTIIFFVILYTIV